MKNNVNEFVWVVVQTNDDYSAIENATPSNVFSKELEANQFAYSLVRELLDEELIDIRSEKAFNLQKNVVGLAMQEKYNDIVSIWNKTYSDRQIKVFKMKLI